MNEIIAIGSFLFFGLLILIVTKFGKSLLYGLSIFIIIATNSTIGLEVKVFGWSISWAIIMFSMSFLLSDILAEYFGREDAFKVAYANLAFQILFTLYIFTTSLIEPSGQQSQKAYDNIVNLYSTSPRVTLGAISASLGNFVNVWIYLFIKKHFAKFSFLDKLWIRNNISVIIGQTCNTALFFYIALYGVLENIHQVVIGAMVLKVVITLFSSPLLYLAGWVLKLDINFNFFNDDKKN